MKRLVLVSGFARSGTSLMCRMLQAAGLEVITDGRMKADEDNPHGYFETRRVSQLSKDPTADVRFVQENQGKVLKVLCHMLPKLPADQAYATIFMVRDPAEIARSVEKMNARRMRRPLRPVTGFDPSITRAVLRGQDWVRKNSPDNLVVGHRALCFLGPDEVAAAVARFVGLEGTEDAMAACVDPELYRNRA